MRGRGGKMRVPVVRLSFERLEGEEAGALRGETIGFGLIVFCLLTLLMGNVAGFADGNLMALRLAYGASFAAVLIAGASADARFHSVFRRLAPAVACSVACTAVVPLLALAAAAGGAVATAAAAIGGVALGGASAFLVLFWGIAYGRMEATAITVSAAVGASCGFLLFACCLALAPRAVTLALVALSPLANAYLLCDRVTDRLPNPVLRDMTYFSELRIDRGSFAAKLAPSFFAMGFAVGTQFAHATYNPVSLGNPAFLGVTALACAVCTVALGLVARYIRARDLMFTHAFRILVPLLALLALPMPLVAGGDPSLAEAPLMSDLVLCVALTWAFLAHTSQSYRLSPVFVFGLGVGSAAVGVAAAGLALEPGIDALAGTVPANVLGLVCTLFALIVVSAFFPRAVDIHAIVSKSFSPEELGGAGASEDGPSWDGGAWGADRGHAGTDAAACADPAPETPAPDSDADDAPRKGRFLRRCERVADMFLLSRREADVLVLLAKGRNVSFIKDQLCISEGTAKTHVHHVYKKLNVHSQQELIALVDGIDCE